MRNARLVMPGLRHPVEDFDSFLRLAERGVGGFCVFGGDDELAARLRALQEAAPHPLIFASDVEDGAGQQFPGLTRHPPAWALEGDAAEAAGIRTAIEARAIGVTMAFAPVCDVLSEPRNPIIQGRAFRDPVDAAPRFVRGARRFGLRTCAKHFPGHGGTSLDSHLALPLVEADAATWRARDLPPFQACIDAGVDAVMTAHLACPGLTGSDTLPATLSADVLLGLLRGEMGFAGLVLTDALLMDGVLQGRTEPEAARLALAAGCDVLLCPDDVEGVLAAAGGADAEESLARVAAAAEPLPDALERAAAASVTEGGTAPAGPGPHPLEIVDLDRAGDSLAQALGGIGPRAARTVVLARSDRAWGGPLELSEEARAKAAGAQRIVLLGPKILFDGLSPEAWIHAPGRDPATLAEIARRLA